jgi:hypothetical protein
VRPAVARLLQIADAERRYRKRMKDTADLEDKYKRDDYGRRYACASPRICSASHVPLTAAAATPSAASTAVRALLQEWDNCVQSAAVTARAMDEVRCAALKLQLQLHSRAHCAASGPAILLQ